ncbi:hypothetical protein ANCDUO_02049 [Ancylostoma duodenale]|uniref:Uncharacterized protein n=1 Tax=Ancylostoma duodenale TaxID=51022 RepID=A0A0C2H7Q9_9BILA|nr:hypothetical protein ANCDUO_02049 [Ancylostoma duodenale]
MIAGARSVHAKINGSQDSDRPIWYLVLEVCKKEENVFEHKYPSKTWAEPSDFVSLLGTDDAIYMLLPRTTADGNIYQHIAKLMIQMDSLKNAKGLKWAKSSFLSLGNFDVTDIESYDKAADTM